MATHSVKVLIKARDEASKKFGVIGVSSKVMGAALKSTARSIRWSFTRAFAGIAAVAKMAFSRITTMFKRMASFSWKWAKRAALGFGLFSGYAVKMAMDAEESENLFEVSMAGMAAATRKWSEQLSESLGLNAYEIRRMVSTLNVMLGSMGLAPNKAAEMSKTMTKLTYDMASFYNLKTEEAFQKLQSGITGEMEPLKRLGILVNETTTKSWALKNGIIKEGQALTETQKVRARYNVILEQTNKAQGDMERTLGSTTNVFRAIKDQVKLLSIEYGKILLPAGTKVANKMKEFLVENREEIIRFAGKAYSGMVLIKDIFKAYINFMKDDWKEGFRKSLDSTVVLFKAWGQSLKVVFEKIFTDIGANITTWLYNARQWKAARKFLIKNILEEEGGRQTIWGGTMYGVGEKYATKEEAARATDRIGKEADRILSIYGPEGSGFEQKKSIETTPWGKVGEQIAAINRGALEQIKDIMPEFAKGVEKAFAEHGKRLQDLKRPASAPSGEPTAPGVPTPDEGEPKTAFGRLAQQLQAREARLLTAAPGAKYDYARQTAKNTTEHLKLANQQTKQQSKLVELSQKAHELFSSIGWFQPAPEKAASQTAPEKVASQPATEKAANITVSTQAGQSNYAGSGNVELYTKGTLQNTGLAVKLLEKMTKILDKMELRQGRGGPGLRPANLS